MAEKDITATPIKMIYSTTEKISFELPPENNPYVKGYLISGEMRSRDPYNLTNQLAESGIHFKDGTPNIDLEAYRQEANKEQAKKLANVAQKQKGGRN